MTQSASSDVSPHEERPSLLGLSRTRLRDTLGSLVDRPYRIEQIYRGIYEQGIEDFAALTSLSKHLRQQLEAKFSISLPEIADQHHSADGTVKYLLRLIDGATIEAVDIPEEKRNTLCISSQAGCALACRFCVTGYWGAGRNLSAGEIVAQVLISRKLSTTPDKGLNLVFMGMGEPLLNLENLAEALEILLEQISWRRITVSTAGIIPGIEDMMRWSRRPQLAISLHAPDNDRRSELMPINQKYPLQDLLKTLARFPLAPKQRITFEYILIRDFNDSLTDADALVQLLRPLRAKVNLIPINPDPTLGANMVPTRAAKAEAFRQRLIEGGLMATKRRQRGDDVSAACGQLRVPNRTPRGFRRSNLPF